MSSSSSLRRSTRARKRARSRSFSAMYERSSDMRASSGVLDDRSTAAYRTGRSSGLPSTQGAKERSDVAGEQVGDLHGGEVPTLFELRPVLDVSIPIEDVSEQVVGREHGHAGRRRRHRAPVPLG